MTFGSFLSIELSPCIPSAAAAARRGVEPDPSCEFLLPTDRERTEFVSARHATFAAAIVSPAEGGGGGEMAAASAPISPGWA